MSQATSQPKFWLVRVLAPDYSDYDEFIRYCSEEDLDLHVEQYTVCDCGFRVDFEEITVQEFAAWAWRRAGV